MPSRIAAARGNHAGCGTIAGSARHRRTWKPMSNELLVSYDTFPYQSHPFRQSHPDRLATIGQLFGMTPPAVERARVLEIGCASGGNLLPMAESLPNAEFVGVDLSPRQVEEGRDDVRRLGLANVRLVAMDITDFPADLGAFDYIIAHGVYSWVPTPVQEQLLRLCRRHLAPSGIAYISYNALPGWRMRSVVRDAMIYHTRGATDPALRVAQARAMLDFLEESTRDDVSAYGAMLRTEAERLRRAPDFYLFHEHLEPVNQPEYFYRFMERAALHDLAYLGEAEFSRMLGNDFGTKVAETLARVAPDVLRREQYMDFLRNRSFRETLLVHKEVVLNRKVSPLRLMSLRIASKARPARDPPDLQTRAVEEFRTPEGHVLATPNRVTKAAAVVLARHWPIAVTFDALHAEARALLTEPDPSVENERGLLASDLLRCYGAGVVELRSVPSPFVAHAGERPVASALARLQAERGTRVTNRRHELLTLDEDLCRLCRLLDGSRRRSDLAESAWRSSSSPGPAASTDAALERLALLALLVG
jgi:SAM-dependent methyltransferase